MAKRFTDTGKWKKGFIKGLSAKMKLLWFYILDDCDHAGIWEVDLEVAGLRIGETFSYEEAFEALGEKLVPIGKTKWFVRDFIFFQYGELRENNNMHKSVLSVLKKYNIDLTQPLLSPSEGAKVKVQGKVQGKGKGLEEVQEKPLGPRDHETVEFILDQALGDIYLDQEQMKWPHLDFAFEVETFRNKVRGSPEHYHGRDASSLRLALQHQLRNSKGKPKNGKQGHQDKSTEHLSSLMEGYKRRNAGFAEG